MSIDTNTKIKNAHLSHFLD